MENNIRKNSFIVAIVAMIFGMGIQAQAQDTIGIHVLGGYSSESLRSSNIGQNNQARGYNSFASGYASEASGHTSTALGGEAKATGNYSMALGNYVTASAENSFVFGTGFSSAFPLVNSTKGIMMGVKSQYPTFTISAAITGNLTGKVGIGNVTDPQAKLHIKGDAIEDADIFLVSTGVNKSAVRFRNDDNSITVGSNNVMCINALSSIVQESKTIKLNASNNIQMTSKVGINTVNTNTGYALAVSGGILTDQVLIRDVSDWPDYVFGKGHALMSLNNVKAFIDKNHHLPDVPSAKEVEENGVNVAEMQKVLLKKIEELTLYTIEQQHLIEELQKKIERLENQ